MCRSSASTAGASCPGRSSSPARSGRQPSLALLSPSRRSTASPSSRRSRACASGRRAELVEAEQRRADDRRRGRRRRTIALAPTSRSPSSIAPSRRPSPAWSSPPPSRTSTGSSRRARAARARRGRARRPRRRAGRRSRPRPRRAAASAKTTGGSSIDAAAAGSGRGGSPRPARSASRGRSAPGPRCSSAVFGPRPSSLRAAADTRGEADVVAAAPVAGDRAERGEARVPAVGRDADAVDPGAADDRDAPAALGPGAQDGEGVVADERPRSPSRARSTRLAQLVLLGREVDAGEQELRDLGDRSVAESAAPARARLGEEAVEHVERSRRGRGGAASCAGRATSASTAPSARDEREVGLRVAAVDGERRAARSRGPRRRTAAGALRPPRAAARRAPRPARTGRSADARAAPCARSTGSPVTRGLDREPLVGGDVLDEPEQLGRERRLRQRLDPSAADARGHLDHVVVGEARRACPSLRTSTSCTSPSSATSDADEPDRRLAVERAAALLEQRRLLGRASGRGRARAARARSRRPSPRAGRPSSCSASTRSCA